MEKLLRESVNDAPVKAGNRWKVIVAKPGKGTSGTYSEELFQRDAAKIIAPGAQAYINHDEARDPEKMIGTYPEAAYWSEEDKAVVAELSVFSHWKGWFEEVAPHCGMSLYAMGNQDDDGNVTEFLENPYNGADLVARPGLAGSGVVEKLYEAAIAASTNTSSKSVGEEGKDPKKMDPKDLEAIQALTTAVEALVSAQTAQSAEKAQVEVNDAAVEEKVAKIAAGLDAVEAARENLLPSQVESLRTKAKTGVDVTPLIEEYKVMVAEAKTLVESADADGVVRGSDQNTKYGAWA